MTPLNSFQRAIVDDYGGGDYAHLTDAEDAMSDTHGDTLFTFLMREMNEVGDLDDALRMLNNAIGDIQVAVASLENLDAPASQ